MDQFVTFLMHSRVASVHPHSQPLHGYWGWKSTVSACVVSTSAPETSPQSKMFHFYSKLDYKCVERRIAYN